MASMRDEKAFDRRQFLSTLTWAIGVLIGAGMGIPAIAYIIGPAVASAQTQTWIRLGSTSKLELGTPTLFKTTIQRQTGWIVNEEEVSVYVFTENGREFIAMSNICTVSLDLMIPTCLHIASNTASEPAIELVWDMVALAAASVLPALYIIIGFRFTTSRANLKKRCPSLNPSM